MAPELGELGFLAGESGLLAGEHVDKTLYGLGTILNFP